MIAHVAERGEEKGRVVLQLVPAEPLNRVALAVALRIAEAFNAEMEAVFVEDTDILEGMRYPAVRGFSIQSSTTSAESITRIERDWRLAARPMLRDISEAAAQRSLTLLDRRMRGEIGQVLATVCAMNGPWNIVVIGHTLTESRAAGLDGILAAVRSATGLVIAGRSARRTSGAVVALIETLDDVLPMQRLANRLRERTGDAVRYLVVAGSEEPAPWLEAQVSLVLASDSDRDATVGTLCADGHVDDPMRVGEIVQRQQAGLVIVRCGGRIVPDGRALRALAEATPCAVVALG